MKRGQRGGIIFRLLALLMLVLLCSLVYMARQPLLRLAGNWWKVEDRQEKSDAILMLGDDNFAGDRATRAAELYHEGMAPVVVASGRMLRSYAGISELEERDLESRGVPSTAIVRLPQRAENTREEAATLRDFVTGHRWKRVLLVTSNYHTRRAAYIFRKIFPPDVSVLVVAARDFEFDPDHWWETRQGRKLFFLEAAGYATAVWEQWQGEGSSSAAQSSATALTR
jgi:uncharacterized SAM-binding protein YcdF (DUF218 family)